MGFLGWQPPQYLYFQRLPDQFTDPQTKQTTAYNLQIQEWPTINYLIYHLVERAAGRTPLSFADTPLLLSRMPRTEYFACPHGDCIADNLYSFFLVRRYSMRHPEHWIRLSGSENFHVHEESTHGKRRFPSPPERILVALSVGLILFIPLSFTRT